MKLGTVPVTHQRPTGTGQPQVMPALMGQRGQQMAEYRQALGSTLTLRITKLFHKSAEPVTEFSCFALPGLATDTEREVIRAGKRPRVPFKIVEELHAGKVICPRRIIAKRQHKIARREMRSKESPQPRTCPGRQNQVIG